MSTTKDNLATTPLPEEEESKPLLTEKPDNSIITSSGKKINGNSRSPNKSSLIKSSLHHRSADNQLDNNGIGDGSKQVLFRTGSHQTGPLSVHYQTKDDDSNNIKMTTFKEDDGSPKDANGHRFQVAKVNSNPGDEDSSDDRNSDSEADNDSLRANIYATAGYDTRNLKSFKHYTREALPRVDNYRNMTSIHGYAERPTLDELHGVQTTIQHDSKKGTIIPNEPIDTSKQTKFGWIEGVLIRCLLNIWGVILFIRLSWVAAQAGILYGTITVVLSSVATVITTLSMSAICTNGEVKGGGTYYMISRSLGPEFGGAIGIIFSLANAVAIAMYAVGFSETVRDMMYLMWGYVIFDGGMNDVRLISCITVIILLGIVFVGTAWESKTQMVLLAILLVAMANFMFGSIFTPPAEKMAKGYIGYSSTLFWENMKPAYRDGMDFISVFAIYFPACTGILAGANISGDLRDPSVAIPKGTLWSIIITTITYVGFLIMVAASNLRDANGIVELVANKTVTPAVLDTIRNCNLAPDKKCHFGSMNFFQVIEMMSWFGPMIYAGIYAASLSSALASLVSAPKVFQALCQDKLLPGIEYFGKGFGINNEPKRGYVLAFLIAIGCCLIGELNAIAPIISNFFLAAYTLINYACFHSTLVKSPGFRPAFKYYNSWSSLLGAIFCLLVMFLMSWFSALLTFLIVLGLYVWIQQRKPDVNWGSSAQASNYRSAIQSVYRLNLVPEHVKTYRPQILLLSGSPGTHSSFVDLAYLITKSSGMLLCGNIVTSPISNRAQNVILQDSNLWLVNRNVKAFVNLVQEANFFQGVKAMIQATGIGKLRPNIVMLGFKSDWQNVEQNELLDYFKTIHFIFDKHLSLMIVAIPENLESSTLAISDSRSNGAGNSVSSSVSINIHSKESGIGSDGNISSSNISQTVVNEVSFFATKQKKGYIDVWWLYDDGGLTLLLPYLIANNQLWKECKLRIFALVNKKSELDTEQRNMAALLSKFRIDFSDVIIITDIMKPPSDESKAQFKNLIRKYIVDEGVENPEGPYDKLYITESDLLAFKDKNYRHMRLRELLLNYSKNSNLVVMTLPMPRKNRCPAVLYMAWLETLTKNMPPIMLMRGNQTDVLTFYS